MQVASLKSSCYGVISLKSMLNQMCRPNVAQETSNISFRGCCYVLLCAASRFFIQVTSNKSSISVGVLRWPAIAPGSSRLSAQRFLNFALKSIVSWFMNIHDIYWILYDFIGISRLKFFVSLMLCGLLQPVSVRLYTVQLSNANGVAEDVRRFLQPILAHSISRDSHELSLSEFEPSLRQDR